MESLCESLGCGVVCTLPSLLRTIWFGRWGFCQAVSLRCSSIVWVHHNGSPQASGCGSKEKGGRGWV